jgi:hypothetical protein
VEGNFGIAVHLENFIPEAEILNGAGTMSNIVEGSAYRSDNSSPNLTPSQYCIFFV